MKIFCNCDKKIKEIKEEVNKVRIQQFEFLKHAQDVLSKILDNDKRKFMYELQQEDFELIQDGKKLRKIRKIIS